MLPRSHGETAIDILLPWTYYIVTKLSLRGYLRNVNKKIREFYTKGTSKTRDTSLQVPLIRPNV